MGLVGLALGGALRLGLRLGVAVLEAAAVLLRALLGRARTHAARAEAQEAVTGHLATSSRGRATGFRRGWCVARSRSTGEQYIYTGLFCQYICVKINSISKYMHCVLRFVSIV